MDQVRLSVSGARADLTLARPGRHNAITPVMLAEVAQACGQVAEAGCDVVVVWGEGSDFSVGYDLDAFEGEGAADGARLGGEAVDALVDLEAVTVAAVQGWAVGGGAALAAACDLRVGEPGTTIRIPEVPLGIPLGWGAVPMLVADLGPSITKDLVMTGRDMDADEALARGFLARLAPEDALEAGVEALVGQLLATAPGPLRSTKQQVAAAADIARTGPEDAARLREAVSDPSFRNVFERYVERVRGSR